MGSSLLFLHVVNDTIDHLKNLDIASIALVKLVGLDSLRKKIKKKISNYEKSNFPHPKW